MRRCQRVRRRAFVLIEPPLLLLAALVLAGCSLAGDLTPPPGYEQGSQVLAAPAAALTTISFPAAPPSAAAGAEIYAQNCSRCHGPAGAGDGEFAAELDPPPTNFTDAGLAAKRTPAEWFEIITNGRLESLMPPWRDELSAAERWDVVAYLYLLSLEPDTLEAGRAVFADQCADCHGMTGLGDGPTAATLDRSPPDFTDGRFMALKSNADFSQAISQGSGAMPGFSAVLSAAELDAVTAYVRALSNAAPQPPVAAAPKPAAGDGMASEAEALAAAPARTGRVFGVVRNRSTGQSASDGMQVTLHRFEGFQEVETLTANTDKTGAYSFEGVALTERGAFVVSTEYEALLYASDVLMVGEDDAGYQADLDVFDTTTDTGVIWFDQLHLILEAGADRLRVVEVAVFSNRSDRTLIPAASEAPTVAFELPAGAANLQFDESTAPRTGIEVTPEGFALTGPIYPRAEPYQLVFSFVLPYDGKLEFAQPLAHPVTTTSILTTVGPTLSGPTLSHLGQREFQSQAFEVYSVAALSAGDAIQFEMRGGAGRGLAGLVSPESNSVGLILSGAVLLAVVGGLGWWWRQRVTPVAAAPTRTGSMTAGQAAARRDALLREIADLDDAFAAGETADAAYHRARSARKRELIELLTAYDLDV